MLTVQGGGWRTRKQFPKKRPASAWKPLDVHHTHITFLTRRHLLPPANGTYHLPQRRRR